MMNNREWYNLFEFLAKLSGTVWTCAILWLAIKHRHDMSGVVWAVLLVADSIERKAVR